MNERPQSEKLIELHIYVIPSILWQDKLRSAVNQVISDTISAGFIRVRPDSNLEYLRGEIVKQLGEDVIPREFIFCKSVGRCLTQVRVNQETNMKAYHFLPPNSYCPELFLLDLDTASRSTPSLKDLSKWKSSNIKIGNENNDGFDSINQHLIGDDHQSAYYNTNNGQYSQKNNASSDDNDKSYQNSSKNDYFKNALADVNKSGGNKSHINLNDYPTLTSEEIRMLQGMSDKEIMEYLINNGHANSDDQISSNTANNNYSGNENHDSLYEEDGPQRSYKPGNHPGIIPTVNIEDSEFDDSNMSDMEKYFSPIKCSAVFDDYDDEINSITFRATQNQSQNISVKKPKESEKNERRPINLSPPLDQNMNEYEHYVSLIEKYKYQRIESESRRDDLIRKAKQLYAKTANQKNIARDMWKKRYFEEKKRNPPMDDHLNKQRSELDAIHRKIMSTMESYIKDNRGKSENQKVVDLGKMRIQSKKLEYEIEEAQRGVDEAKLKLTWEIKMTHQARAEVVALRADLVQKKINLSMARNQQLSSMGTQDIYRPTRVSLIKPVK